MHSPSLSLSLTGTRFAERRADPGGNSVSRVKVRPRVLCELRGGRLKLSGPRTSSLVSQPTPDGARRRASRTREQGPSSVVPEPRGAERSVVVWPRLSLSQSVVVCARCWAEEGRRGGEDGGGRRGRGQGEIRGRRESTEHERTTYILLGPKLQLFPPTAGPNKTSSPSTSNSNSFQYMEAYKSLARATESRPSEPNYYPWTQHSLLLACSSELTELVH